ncbi:MAG: ADOP family duplicated permease [Gemmatimonadota bacterium]
MHALMQQVRVAIRSLSCSPGFAVTATLTLALGIGLSTAVFTVADTLLIRRLPVTDQDRIVVLYGEARTGSLSNFPLGLDEIREIARRSRSLVGAVGFFSFEGAPPTPVRDGERLYRLRRALVSGNFFDVLGSRPELGRGLTAEDDIVGAAPVVVLSHRAWRHEFGGDVGVLGRSLVMHGTGRTVRIVGVMPQGLDYPRGTDFWAPVVATTTGTADSLHVTSNALDLIGRLRPGAVPAAARDELTAFFGRPDAGALQKDLRGVAHTFPELVLGDTRPAVIALAGAAALLLLLACINAANLLLVRGLARVREIAVRSALGASRRQVVGQLLIESAVLAALGAVIGAGLAAVAVQGFVSLAPSGLPRLDEISVNRSVLFLAIGVTALATLLFALAPALVTSRVELTEALRAGARQSTGSRRFRLAREVLVAGQVALAVIVLSFAGLMTRSFIKLGQVDLAFAPRGLVVAELALRMDLSSAAKQTALLDRLLPRVAELPQVAAVTPVLTVPFDQAGGIYGQLATREQTPAEVTGNPMLDMQVIAPTYFRTLGVPVLRGRPFTAEDVSGSPQVVIVSASAARHYWPAGDPIGRQLQWGSGPGEQVTVVGVVSDTRYRDLRSARPSIYFPLRQSIFPVVPLTLLIRSSSAPAGLIPALGRAIAEQESDVRLASATPYEELLEEPLAQPRLNAILLLIFAAAAALLAGIGLFGVIAATVRQRTRELGIRLALGATRADVRRLVTVRGLAIASIGAAVGIAAAASMSRLVASLLFEIRPVDGLTLGMTTALILGVAAVACVVPAQAGARIDPAISLRAEE